MELLKLKGINNGMKKIFSFLCLFFICCSLSAQQIQETIYLRNGSVIKGNIVEQIPNGSVKIQIADGSLLVYQMSEVERITKENNLLRKKGVIEGLILALTQDIILQLKAVVGVFLPKLEQANVSIRIFIGGQVPELSFLQVTVTLQFP